MDMDLMLDVGQANELKLAFRREGWSNEEIKMLSERKGFLRDVREALHDRAEIVQKEQPPKLRYLGNTTLREMTERFDPHEFFKTRPGLYVWPDFAEILAVAKPVNAASDLIIGKFCLEDAANDAEIRAELPAGHVFEDASEFCVYLAGMIERQWGGTAGNLLNNGYANLFYVRGVDGGVFEVLVYWLSDRRAWCVRARSLGDALWDAGSRAFSATAGALEAQAV